MKVTVAICTWNRADLLDQTLTRMHPLRIPEGIEWELLVVNNNCTDYTDAVIARHAGALPIRRLIEPTPGHSRARNCALGEARGDLLLWTDDDVLVTDDWLASLVEAAGRHPEAAAFGGPIDPWFPSPPDPDLVEAFPMLRGGFCGLDHDLKEGPLAEDQSILGANMAFRSSVLRAERFDTVLGMRPVSLVSGGTTARATVGGGEETALIERLRGQGRQIVWVPKMRVKHYVEPSRMTLPYLESYCEAYGRDLVRIRGIPECPQVLGLPRWLLRQWVQAKALQLAHRMMLHRRMAYQWTHQERIYMGMLNECLSLRRLRREHGSEADMSGTVTRL